MALLQQVSTRSKTGAKGKATEIEKFWTEKFSKVYPTKVQAVGKSRIRAAVAEQIVDCILVTHFENRCVKLCRLKIM